MTFLHIPTVPWGVRDSQRLVIVAFSFAGAAWSFMRIQAAPLGHIFPSQSQSDHGTGAANAM